MEEDIEEQEKLPWEGMNPWKREDILTPEQKEMFRRYQYEKYKDRKDDIYYEDIIHIVTDPDNANDDYDDLRALLYRVDYYTVFAICTWHRDHPILGFLDTIWYRLTKRLFPPDEEGQRINAQQNAIWREEFRSPRSKKEGYF